MDAIRLINLDNSECTFERGHIPNLTHIQSNYFFVDTATTAKLLSHPAPRPQYVVTLKGKLEFTVTNGDAFIIEPGIILIAQDIHGRGHQWRILDGDEWHRIYIVPDPTTNEFTFIPSA